MRDNLSMEENPLQESLFDNKAYVITYNKDLKEQDQKSSKKD